MALNSPKHEKPGGLNLASNAVCTRKGIILTTLKNVKTVPVDPADPRDALGTCLRGVNGDPLVECKRCLSPSQEVPNHKVIRMG